MSAPNPARVFHRMIRLECLAPGRVVAGLADDAHHFTLVLEHDAARVVRVAGRAHRFPWDACPGATARLREITGMALSPRSTAVGKHTRARENCTHLFDLAGLAVAFAARGDALRAYHATVRDRDDGGEGATLARDGAPLLHWQLRAGQIEAPEPYAGIALRGGGFLAWAESSLAQDEAEAAIVLRRASAIGRVRHFPFHRHVRASDTQAVNGQCFTFQPGVAEQALRQPDTRHDYSQRTDALRRELEASLQEMT
jgi:hypothetical protein